MIWMVALGGILGLLVYSWRTLIPRAKIVESQRRMPTPVVLEHHCKEHIGPPRVLQVTENVWVAVGFDLANTILIKTNAGHVIVDVAMSPPRAHVIRKALIEAAGDAPIHTIIYTHSHIDHVGGASGWAGNGTRIWSTEAVTSHFFKQYGVFRKVNWFDHGGVSKGTSIRNYFLSTHCILLTQSRTCLLKTYKLKRRSYNVLFIRCFKICTQYASQTESLRGSRQYGTLVAMTELPCSALGARVDLDAMRAEAGFLLPTDTFRGNASFSVGGEDFELIEAHGETHDMLVVWLPRQKVLLPGDNYYR